MGGSKMKIALKGWASSILLRFPPLIGADGGFHGRTPVEVFLYEHVLITLPVPWLRFPTCIFGNELLPSFDS